MLWAVIISLTWLHRTGHSVSVMDATPGNRFGLTVFVIGGYNEEEGFLDDVWWGNLRQHRLKITAFLGAGVLMFLMTFGERISHRKLYSVVVWIQRSQSKRILRRVRTINFLIIFVIFWQWIMYHQIVRYQWCNAFGFLIALRPEQDCQWRSDRTLTKKNYNVWTIQHFFLYAI